MPSQLTLATPREMIPTVGLVSRRIGATMVDIGGTSGPPSVETVLDMRNIALEIDGVTAPIARFDIIDGQNVRITFTFVQFNANNLAMLHPGATSVTAAGVTTITPKQAGALFVPEDYLKDFTLTYRIGPDGTAKLVIPEALVTRGNIGADNKSIGKAPITVEGRVDLAAEGATTDDPSFGWVLTPATVPAP
jgi:hypothetical protein